MFDELPVLTDAQVAALAQPGESWEAARVRAERLYSCVQACTPCYRCNATGVMRWGGWIDDPSMGCPVCARWDSVWRSNPNIYD